MQTSKSSYFDVEAFHNNGKLSIQFMPEYEEQIRDSISKSGFSGSSPIPVECFKFTHSCNKYLKLTMLRIDIEYSSEAISWFLTQSWKQIENYCAH